MQPSTKQSGNLQGKRSFATLLVMLCTLLSRILGFVKVAVINAVFGAAGVADVLNAVFSIPNNLRKLMAEGALSSAFIPQLNHQLSHNNKEQAQKLTQQIIGFQYVILVPIIILAIIFAPQAIKLFLRFPVASEMALAQSLFAYFIPYLLIISLAAIFMAVLNSHGQFLVAALSPLLFSVVMICAILFTTRYLGVYSMAVGVLGGGLVQLIMQAIPFKRLGYSLLPNFSFTNPAFKIVIKHWLPVVLTSSIFAVNQQISVLLGSTLPSGASSALANAIVFFQLPYGIFSASINTVYFPQMSRRAALHNYVDLNESLISGLKLLMVFLLPSAVIMSLLGREIISVAFMRGAFMPENANLAAGVLTGFCTGMFFTAAYNFMVRYFYSRGSFNTPFVSALFTCALDVVLSLALIRTPLGVAGLAYANSLAFSLSFFILALLAYFKYGRFGLAHLFLPFLKVVLACLLSVGVYFVLNHFIGFNWWQQRSSLKTFGLLALSGLSMLMIVLLAYKLLKVNFLEGLRRKTNNR